MTASASTAPASRFLYSNGTCAIGTTIFRCLSIKHHHVINQIPVAEIVVIPDDTEKNLPATIKDIYTQLLKTKKGDSVLTTFDFSVTPSDTETGTSKKELDNKPVPVFRGVLLGWSPVWIGPTSLRMTIWAIHPLGMLDWTSSIVDSVQGSGFDDYKLPTIIGKTQELVPYMKGGYTADDVSKDLWKNVIKKELINICKSKRFGEVNCQALVDYLEDAKGEKTDGSEQPLSLNIDNPLRVVLDIRRRLYTAAAGRRSLWDALLELSDVYKFSIIGRSLDYSIAPIVPALGGPLPQSALLYWRKYVPREEYNSLVRDIAQSTGMLRGLGGVTGFFDTEARQRKQEFRNMPNEPVTAGVEFFPTPRFLDFDCEPFFKTKKTLGLGGELLLASGYKLNETVSPVSTLNKQYNAIPTVDMKNYADFLQNDRGFSGSTAVLRGSVDYNLCPGNIVVAEPPLRYQVGEQFDDMLVGLVWGVTNILDSSSSKTSGTYLVLSHIRTSKEQVAIEVKKHPLYNKRWISSPLVVIPGFTEAPQNA